MNLQGKTIFITGATSGFGKAAAELLAGEGVKLILSGRRTERLEALQTQFGDNVHILSFDIRSRADVEQAIKNVPERFAQIDVLVNNAGLALGLESVEAVPPENIEQMVDTNIKGLIYATQAVLPGMIARGGGHIVNIGSIAGNHPYPGGNVYGATKAFVKQFSLNMRADLVGNNIRVTNIEPGMAETEFSVVRFKGDENKAAKVYEGVKALTAEDIAEAIHWCISLPAHVNVNSLEIMPTQQAFSGFAVSRDTV